MYNACKYIQISNTTNSLMLHTKWSYSTVQKCVMYMCLCVCYVIYSTITALTLWFTSTPTHIHVYNMYNRQKCFFTTQNDNNLIRPYIFSSQTSIQLDKYRSFKQKQVKEDNISCMSNTKISKQMDTNVTWMKLVLNSYTKIHVIKNRFLHIFLLHKLP